MDVKGQSCLVQEVGALKSWKAGGGLRMKGGHH